MEWDIEYYNSSVRKTVKNLPLNLFVKYQAMIDKMRIHGPHLGMPHTKAMGKGLFEMRLKGQGGIARVFYCTAHKKTITVLHSFIKKTQETPKNDLDLAIQRLKEVDHDLQTS